MANLLDEFKLAANNFGSTLSQTPIVHDSILSANTGTQFAVPQPAQVQPPLQTVQVPKGKTNVVIIAVIIVAVLGVGWFVYLMKKTSKGKKEREEDDMKLQPIQPHMQRRFEHPPQMIGPQPDFGGFPQPAPPLFQDQPIEPRPPMQHPQQRPYQQPMYNPNTSPGQMAAPRYPTDISNEIQPLPPPQADMMSGYGNQQSQQIQPMNPPDLFGGDNGNYGGQQQQPAYSGGYNTQLQQPMSQQGGDPNFTPL